MNLDFPVKSIQEGAAIIQVPYTEELKLSQKDNSIHRSPVFYNSLMKLNRDSAILSLEAFKERTSKPLVVCEPLCGTGVRGVRMALEIEGIERVVMGDLNPKAVYLAKINSEKNGVSNIVKIQLIDANRLLSFYDYPNLRLDFIDIDPFGSPITYLESAIRSCKNGGLIALTATDMAPLCGVNPKACLRRYGGRPLRTEYCHESALRLLTGALVKNAAKHDVAVYPVFGYSLDHYIRLYAILNRGARKANHALTNMGFILHCFKCLNRKTMKPFGFLESLVCDHCGSEMTVGGPLWLGKLSEEEFCDKMIGFANQSSLNNNLRLIRIIHLIRNEASALPTFYNIDKICSRLKIASQPINAVISKLLEIGHKAVKTHFQIKGIKTSASINELEMILRSLR